MDFLANELRAGELAPILIGDSSYSKLVSKRFFDRHGLISHIFCSRVSLLRRLSLTAKYHRVTGFDQEELLLITLEDFAKSVENRDIILYLIPGTESALQFILRNRERLEPNFVLANAHSLSELIGK